MARRSGSLEKRAGLDVVICSFVGHMMVLPRMVDIAVNQLWNIWLQTVGEIWNRLARSLLSSPKRSFISVRRNSSMLLSLRLGPNLRGLCLKCLTAFTVHLSPRHLLRTNGAM